MPYNVIILTGTVIALGFGSIFNLLVRRFVLVEEIPAGPLAGVVAKVKDMVARLKGKEVAVGGGVKADGSGGVGKNQGVREAMNGVRKRQGGAVAEDSGKS